MKIDNFMTLLVILIFVALLGVMLTIVPNSEGAEWSKKDIALETTWQILHYIDYEQTKQIAKNPDRYYEKNPLIGEHPSKGKVNTMMGLFGVGHLLVTNFIPPDCKVWKVACRDLWHGVSIATKAGAIYSNYEIGIRW